MNFTGHGNKPIKELILESNTAKKIVKKLKHIPISQRVARECIDLAYGFFSPLEGFMNSNTLNSVCQKMKLIDGTLWPIPILLDMDRDTINKNNLKIGDQIILSFQNQPLALLDIEEIYQYDKQKIAQAVLGTTEEKHPGVKMFDEWSDYYLAGPIKLVNEPIFQPPFDRFWYTPLQLRKIFQEKDWERIVAHQTRNVPHTGHEWLMKGAWFSTNANLAVERLKTGILVSCIIGPKRMGDYIDEAILLGQQQLNDSNYFNQEIHMVSFVLWDMRYAGPKEALLHAIIRSNLGCTHHMFGRDHAGVGSYYDPYDAHRIFDKIPEGSLNIKPIRVLEWWYCPICQEVTYSGLCGHTRERQNFSGTMIRSIIQDKVQPTNLLMRPEVFQVMLESAEKYGFGSPFCNEKYLKQRQPVFRLFSINS
ncbi:MAG: sulfate adenylyltransferase [Atribacterota bacterium]|nr:sulfate adenylyltransferase [Atribacterota bacterium]MDD5637458.1 sulfate adenylyltransferase [Atribacterota bacterium]